MSFKVPVSSVPTPAATSTSSVSTPSPPDMKVGSAGRGGEEKTIRGEKNLTDCGFLGFLKLRDFWEGGAEVMKVPARPLPEPSEAGGGPTTSTSVLSSPGPFEARGGIHYHCPTPPGPVGTREGGDPCACTNIQYKSTHRGYARSEYEGETSPKNRSCFDPKTFRGHDQFLESGNFLNQFSRSNFGINSRLICGSPTPLLRNLFRERAGKFSSIFQ